MTSQQVFAYSKNTELQGILRYFFDLGTFWDNVEIHGSSVFPQFPSYVPSNAFDFNDDHYWLGDHNEETVTLTFCFKNHFVYPFGFEMKTSLKGDTRPKVFQFSSSLDNRTYANLITYRQSYGKSDSFYFSYMSKPMKCFRLTCIESVDSGHSFDVNQIELYGKLSKNKKIIICNTCAKSFNLQKTIPLFVIISFL